MILFLYEGWLTVDEVDDDDEVEAVNQFISFHFISSDKQVDENHHSPPFFFFSLLYF